MPPEKGWGMTFVVWGCDVIGGQDGMQFQIVGKCGQGWSLTVCVSQLQTSNPERVSGGIVCEWQLVDLDSILW